MGWISITRKETESVVCISGKVEVLLKTEGKMREAIQVGLKCEEMGWGDDVLQIDCLTREEWWIKFSLDDVFWRMLG